MNLNGYITPPPSVERFVVDADGNHLYPKPARISRVPRPSSPVGVTLRQLADLEDSIFEDDEKRKQFLVIMKNVDNFKEREGEFGQRRLKALMHCWNTLLWRDSYDFVKKRKRVKVKDPNNHYIP